ncbi:hypothetical protein ACTHPF_05320 [Paenibacillus sp. SAF-054]|uniref:hypothetical protein n=1 Tax=unclassified Paenibacillus TaxID=185978 RepID=UPI003F80400F
MPRKSRFLSKQGVPIWTLLGITFALASTVVLVGFYHISGEESHPGMTNQILSYTGYSRVIEQEEYDFFRQLARRESGVNGNLLNQKTEELIETASAQFYLGNKLGLYGPYSFAQLQEQMKQENAKRRLDKEMGKAIFGPEQFDIFSYYQYVSSNLELKMIDYLASHADETLVRQANSYFEENLELYKRPEQIVYTLTEQGKTDEHTIDGYQLNSLSNADSKLADILRTGEAGQEFSYSFGEILRRGKIVSIKKNRTDFEEKKTAIISDYLKSGYYHELLLEIGNHNPVVYDGQR